MQGVVKAFDPLTGEGLVVRDTDRAEIAIGAGALTHSIFRTLRQGQRVVFDLDDGGRAVAVRSGGEPDMGMTTARV